MRTTLALIAGSLWLMTAAAPAVAHHSFAAEYDSTKPVKVTGVVMRVEWTNPGERWLEQRIGRHGDVYRRPESLHRITRGHVTQGGQVELRATRDELRETSFEPTADS